MDVDLDNLKADVVDALLEGKLYPVTFDSGKLILLTVHIVSMRIYSFTNIWICSASCSRSHGLPVAKR